MKYECINVLCYIERGWLEKYLYCAVWGWLNSVKWILYYESCELKFSFCKYVQWVRPPVWPCQRSRTWPIFKPDATPDLKCTCAKFHHSTPTRSWVIMKTDGRTYGHTRRSHKVFWRTLYNKRKLLLGRLLSQGHSQASNFKDTFLFWYFFIEEMLLLHIKTNVKLMWWV